MRIIISIVLILSAFTLSSLQSGVKRPVQLKDPKTDSLFHNWNTATLHSIQQQIDSNPHPSARKYYENRLAAFKAYVGIEDTSLINRQSIRYSLLEAIDLPMGGRDTYIVEANESGEKVLIRTFVLYLNDSGSADIDTYTYGNSGWGKSRLGKSIALNVGEDLNKYRNLFAKGANHDDVVVTHIKNYQVRSSEYFLFGTLSASWYTGLVSHWNSLRRIN